MMLIELTTVPAAALPVQALKDHLRLGTGFGDEALQDALLESHLRAAIAAIEGRIGKALLARSFKLVLEDWRDATGQALPVAPVGAVASVTLIDVQGEATVVDASRYRLAPDPHRPKLVAVGMLLPAVPAEGRAEVVFEAGFGATWGDVPADLAQAALLLAAEFHERRHDASGRDGGLPFSVQALIERWRIVRVLGGGAA